MLLPLKSPFVPFVTVISPVANPVTFSLNVNLYVILLAFVGLPIAVVSDVLFCAVIVHVGATLSILLVRLAGAVVVTTLLFPTVSVHLLAGTLTVWSVTVVV